MVLLETRNIAYSSILLSICFGHSLTYVSAGFTDQLPATSDVIKVLKDIPLLRAITTSKDTQKGDDEKQNTHKRWPRGDAKYIYGDSDEVQFPHRGVIYDYSKTRIYESNYADTKHSDEIKVDILEDSSGEKKDGACAIRYFYDVKDHSASCVLEGEKCYLEYEEYRTVIPDMNRCLLKDDRCVLIKPEIEEVMLPFSPKSCREHVRKARKANDDREEGPDCHTVFLEVPYQLDAYSLDKLYCQMRDKRCYLGDDEWLSISTDYANCRLEKGRCVKKREFKIKDQEFVKHECHDLKPNTRTRRQSLFYQDICRMYTSQELFYRNVLCEFISDNCYLRIDGKITVEPEMTSCFPRGNRCYPFTPYPTTVLPLVDVECLRQFGLMNRRYLGVPTVQEVYHNPHVVGSDLAGSDEAGFHVGGEVIGKSGYGHNWQPIEASFPQQDPSSISPNSQEEPLENVRSFKSSLNTKKTDSEEELLSSDIWNDSNYTDCVLLLRAQSGKLQKRCYPGNDKTGLVKFDFEKNCRLIDGRCFKVHKDQQFLQKYFHPAPFPRRLVCVKVGGECFLMDDDLLLYTEGDCWPPVCREIPVDPRNTKSYCEGRICQNYVDLLEDQEAGIPVKTQTVDSASFFADALKSIVPEGQLQKKPTGFFYSVSYLFNDSISAGLSMQNHPEKIDEEDNSESGEQEIEMNEEKTDKKEEQNHSHDVKHAPLDASEEFIYYDDSDENEEIIKRKGRISRDVWDNPKYTNCVFHIKKKKNSWETKCYPGNDRTDQINPQYEKNCRMIDGECYKVHKDDEFLSEHMKTPKDEILKCVKLSNRCFLVDKNLLLHNKQDCYDEICENLEVDPVISGNYCDSMDCGHSRSKLRTFMSISHLEDKPKLKLRLLDNENTSPLLQSLKAVVPNADLERNTAAVIFSMGLLFNDSDPSILTARNGNFGGISMENDTSAVTEAAGKSGTTEGIENVESDRLEDQSVTDNSSMQEPKASPNEELELMENILSPEENPTTGTEELQSDPTTDVPRQISNNQRAKEYANVKLRNGFQRRKKAKFKFEEKVDQKSRYKDFSPRYMPVGAKIEKVNTLKGENNGDQKKNTRSARNSNEKEDSGIEYFFNPSSPFIFLGAYPGTAGSNDTLIIHDRSYKYHDENVPTVQEIVTRTIHLDENMTSYEIDKDAILDFMANFPWPHWCAPDENSVEQVQTCCEIRDSCKHRIEPGENRFGLYNEGFYSRLHCSCEYKFFKCLKKEGSVISNSLGVAYFNILAPKCYSLERRVRCLMKNKWLKCRKYGYDEKSQYDYQWLDTPTF